MALRINDTIPDLSIETDQGTIRLHDWVGDGWAVIFSHPKDFTPSAPPSSAPWRSSTKSGRSAA